MIVSRWETFPALVSPARRRCGCSTCHAAAVNIVAIQKTKSGQVIATSGGKLSVGNCGTGAGGFKQGNTCATGGSGDREGMLSKMKDQEEAKRAATVRVDELFNRSLEESGMPEENRKVYREAFEKVKKNMNATAMNALADNCETIKFHRSLQSVTDYSNALHRARGLSEVEGDAVVGGLWVKRSNSKKGTLHLDGGEDAEGIYAHEISHGIDGNNDMSHSIEWGRIWDEEIVKGGAISDYAAVSPKEGFAEYGRLILSGQYKFARETLPKAWGFWKSRGLIL